MISKIKNVSIILLILFLMLTIHRCNKENQAKKELRERYNQTVKYDSQTIVNLNDRLKKRDKTISDSEKQVTGLEKLLKESEKNTGKIKMLNRRYVTRLKKIDDTCDNKIDKLVKKYNDDTSNLKLQLSIKNRIIGAKDQIIYNLKLNIAECKKAISKLQLSIEKKDELFKKALDLDTRHWINFNGPGIVYADKLRVAVASISIDFIKLIKQIFK